MHSITKGLQVVMLEDQSTTQNNNANQFNSQIKYTFATYNIHQYDMI